MKRTETVKTYATNLIEFITGLDLITDDQVEAIKGTRIRSLTRDTIVSDLANIDAPFLVYGRTKNILLCTDALVVLIGEVDVVNGMALAMRDGNVAYLQGDYKLESDFKRAMWSCPNKDDLIAKCIDYLQGKSKESVPVAPDSVPDPHFVGGKPVPAPEPKKEEPTPAAPAKGAPAVVEETVVKAGTEPKKAKTLEELYALTAPAPAPKAEPKPAAEPKKEPTPVRRRGAATDPEKVVVVTVVPGSKSGAPKEEPRGIEKVPDVVAEEVEDAADTVKRLAAEEGIDISSVDW